MTSAQRQDRSDHLVVTLLLLRVDAAVDLQHEFNDEMEEHERHHHPRRPPRHERLVQVEADEERGHCREQPVFAIHVYQLYVCLQKQTHWTGQRRPCRRTSGSS